MVLIKHPVTRLLAPLAIGTVMLSSGCRYFEDKPPTKTITNTDMLVGEWKMLTIDGVYYDFQANNYLFKFTRIGDWQFCYEQFTDPDRGRCFYEGNWRWNEVETTIIIDLIEKDTIVVDTWTIDVVIFDENQLAGQISTTYLNKVSISFEKVL